MFGTLTKKLLGAAVGLTAIAASLLSAAVPALAAGTWQMNMSTASSNIANGATFVVSINANTDSAARAWGANVNFDPAKMSVVTGGVAEGDFLSNWAASNGASSGVAMAYTIDNVNGHVNNLSYYLQGGVGGPIADSANTHKTLATITFQAKASVDAATDITLSSAMFTDVSIVDQTATVTPLTMVIGTPPLPDLSITGLTAVGTTENYVVNFTVNNIGNLDAGASSASIVVDGGTPVVVAVPAITMGSSTPVSQAITISGQTDDIVITVDSTGIIVESNEGNNTASTSYSYVAPPAGQTTDVDGTILNTLTFTQPAAINFGSMSLGNNHKEGALNVKSNAPWQITAASDITDGKMTKYNGSAYTAAVKLHNALKVSTTSGYLTAMPPQTDPSNNIVTLNSTPALLANGVTDGQVTSGDGMSTLGEDRTLNYDQLLVASDANLPNGYTYHIVVSLQASNTSF